jgi:hypothetical protein
MKEERGQVKKTKQHKIRLFLADFELAKTKRRVRRRREVTAERDK